MMDEATYWWNHLSYQQRVFITHWMQELAKTKVVTVQTAYENRESFHTMVNWPEDKF